MADETGDGVGRGFSSGGSGGSGGFGVSRGGKGPVVSQEAGRAYWSEQLCIVSDPEHDGGDELDNPSDEKFRKMERKGVSDSDVRLKPSRTELARLNVGISPQELLSHKLSPELRDLVWRFRYSLLGNRRALNRFATAVDWTDEGEVDEATHLLSKWAPLDTEDALRLLLPEFSAGAHILRPHAVLTLRRASDREISLFLLQLVQALRYEPGLARLAASSTGGTVAGQSTVPATSAATTIVSTPNKSGITSPSPKLTPSIPPQGNSSVVGVAAAAAPNPFGDESLHLGGDTLSPLADFLIERACRSLEIANLLYWYLTVEEGDLKMGGMFSTVKRGLQDRLKGTPTGAEIGAALSAQVSFLSRLGTATVTAGGSKRDRVEIRIGRLKKALSEGGEYSDLLEVNHIVCPTDSGMCVTGVLPRDVHMFKSALYPTVVPLRVSPLSPRVDWVTGGSAWGGPIYGFTASALAKESASAAAAAFSKTLAVSSMRTPSTGPPTTSSELSSSPNGGLTSLLLESQESRELRLSVAVRLAVAKSASQAGVRGLDGMAMMSLSSGGGGGGGGDFKSPPAPSSDILGNSSVASATNAPSISHSPTRDRRGGTIDGGDNPAGGVGKISGGPPSSTTLVAGGASSQLVVGATAGTDASATSSSIGSTNSSPPSTNASGGAFDAKGVGVPGQYKLIFKTGDDMRQDQLIIQMVRLMDGQLKRLGLDLKLTPFSVIATSTTSGIMEMVLDSVPMSQVVERYGRKGQGAARNNPVMAFLQEFSFHPTAQYNIVPETMDTYIKSTAGYCVITYLLGIGDRHLDNILLSKSGHFFHLDFGFILGRDPKPFPPPMRLTVEMIAGMGGYDSENYTKFKSYCCQAYNILRRSAGLVTVLLQLMRDAGIEDLHPDPATTIAKMYEKFRVDIEDEDADKALLRLVDDSVAALFPAFLEVRIALHPML